MKKRVFSTFLALFMLVAVMPSAFAEEEAPAFIKVKLECPDAETLQDDNYSDYAHLLMRYADDKTPIPLSVVYDDCIYATIPSENADRPLEYFVSEEQEFTDKPDADEYYETSFNFYVMGILSAKGVIKGNEKGEALPFDNVTRAEAVAMSMRLLGVDNMPDTDSGFSDVPEDSWFAPAVTKARKLGIVAGDDDTHFAPMRNVSREEMVALTARCLWVSGVQKEKAVSRDELMEKIEVADGDQISDWALSAYETMRTYGTVDYNDSYDKDGNYSYQLLSKPKEAATRFFAAYVTLNGCDMQSYPTPMAVSYGFDKEMPKIDGSTSTYPFTEAVYRNLFYNGYSNPEKPEKHSKSHASYERLINGEVDMIFASVYPASDILELAKSQGVELELIPIAYDAMIFFTNRDNPAKGLTQEQISNIYVKNKYADWKLLGGDNALLYPYCRNTDSGSHAQMERYFLNGKEINKKIRQENTADAMENILTNVMDAQTEDPKGYALGYSIYYYFQNMDEFYDTNKYLKLLEIDGVYPDDETIASGEYPLSNNTYLVLRKDEPEDSPARKMAEFMLTKEGQSCVEEAGFGAIYPPNPKYFKVVKELQYYDIAARDNVTPIVCADIAFPQVEVKGKNTLASAMNKAFDEIRNDFLQTIENMTEDIRDYYEEVDEDEKEYFPYENYLNYEVTKNTEETFSITFTESFYTGGAHPFGDKISLTYNVKKGKELSLCDILGKTQKETNQFVIDKFNKEYEDYELWDLEEEAPYVSFYVDQDKLVMYFQQYQIAPYAMGFPEVRIPLEKIEK